MREAASLEGREHARLFVGLPLPADAAERLAPWQERELAGGRIVHGANLHFTLAFASDPVKDRARDRDSLVHLATLAHPSSLAPLPPLISAAVFAADSISSAKATLISAFFDFSTFGPRTFSTARTNAVSWI